jgi:hypothetical protein
MIGKLTLFFADIAVASVAFGTDKPKPYSLQQNALEIDAAIADMNQRYTPEAQLRTLTIPEKRRALVAFRDCFGRIIPLFDKRITMLSVQNTQTEDAQTEIAKVRQERAAANEQLSALNNDLASLGGN